MLLNIGGPFVLRHSHRKVKGIKKSHNRNNPNPRKDDNYIPSIDIWPSTSCRRMSLTKRGSNISCSPSTQVSKALHGNNVSSQLIGICHQALVKLGDRTNVWLHNCLRRDYKDRPNRGDIYLNC